MAKKSGPKPIGKVTHYYGNLGVAIIKFSKTVDVGIAVRFKGGTTDFKDVIKSMQYDHEAIKTAKKGKDVGIKVKSKVREGDEVFEAE